MCVKSVAHSTLASQQSAPPVLRSALQLRRSDQLPQRLLRPIKIISNAQIKHKFEDWRGEGGG
jgi:hypothetical protein